MGLSAYRVWSHRTLRSPPHPVPPQHRPRRPLSPHRPFPQLLTSLKLSAPLNAPPQPPPAAPRGPASERTGPPRNAPRGPSRGGRARRGTTGAGAGWRRWRHSARPALRFARAHPATRCSVRCHPPSNPGCYVTTVAPREAHTSIT